MKKLNIPVTMLGPARQCGTCTACCEGWLEGEAYGYNFFSGKMCHYKGENNCTIYKNRPEEPCKTYKCEWLVNHSIPEWMKPSLSKVIITKRLKKGITYLEVIEAGQKIDSTVLNWLFVEHLKGTIPNLAYKVNNGQNYLGSQDFIEMVQQVDN